MLSVAAPGGKALTPGGISVSMARNASASDTPGALCRSSQWRGRRPKRQDPGRVQSRTVPGCGSVTGVLSFRSFFASRVASPQTWPAVSAVFRFDILRQQEAPFILGGKPASEPSARRRTTVKSASRDSARWPIALESQEFGGCESGGADLVLTVHLNCVDGLKGPGIIRGPGHHQELGGVTPGQGAGARQYQTHGSQHRTPPPQAPAQHDTGATLYNAQNRREKAHGWRKTFVHSACGMRIDERVNHANGPIQPTVLKILG